MAKLTTDYGIVTCIRAELRPERAAVESNWRRDYVGMTGRLLEYESETRYPNQRFLYFYGNGSKEETGSEDVWHLRTTCGTASIEGNRLTFQTENTSYVFEGVKL